MMKTLTAALVLGAIIVTTACTGELSLQNLACPCIADYVCCNHACTEGNSCPAGESMTDTSTGETTDAELTTFPLSTELGCSTLVGDDLVWMDKAGKIGGLDVTSGAPLTIAKFALPADAVTKCAFATDANNVYVSLYETGTILQLSINGATIGEEAQRFGVFAHPDQLVVDDANVYVIENDSGRIASVAKPTSGAPVETVTIGQASPGAHDLVADSDALYWLDGYGLRKVPKNGGEISTLTSSPGDDATSLLLANGQLYWLSEATPHSVPVVGGSAEQLSLTLNIDGTTHTFDGNVLNALSGADVLRTDGTQLFVAVQNGLYAVSFDGTMREVVEDDRLGNIGQFFEDRTRFIWLSQSQVLVRPVL